MFCRVENYVKQFATWIPYEHRCVGEVRVSILTTRIITIENFYIFATTEIDFT